VKYCTRVREGRNNPAYHKKEVNWIGHILCGNCLLNQFIERRIKGRIGVMKAGGKIRKQIVDYLK
jgi:hypothetical protein